MSQGFLSLEQAERLTGRSRRTIQRYYRDLKETDPKAARSVIQFGISPKGKRQKLFSERWLRSLFPDSVKEEEKDQKTGDQGEVGSGNQGEASGSGGDSREHREDSEIVQILRRELEEKNAQIRAKDEQLGELLQRTRELHILFSRIQEQVNKLDRLWGVPYVEKEPEKGREAEEEKGSEKGEAGMEFEEDDMKNITKKKTSGEEKRKTETKPKTRSFRDWL